MAFKEASWDWVQQLPDTAAATSKWGAIGDWDVSGVKDFTYAFSPDRDATGGSYLDNGNPKAATFVGTDLSKWKTTALTSLDNTFKKAMAMNSDLSGWNVGKVTNLKGTFLDAFKFAGIGLSSWITTSLTTMHSTFWGATLVNVDFGGWDVSRVTSLQYTFRSATNYVRSFSTPLPSALVLLNKHATTQCFVPHTLESSPRVRLPCSTS